MILEVLQKPLGMRVRVWLPGPPTLSECHLKAPGCTALGPVCMAPVRLWSDQHIQPGGRWGSSEWCGVWPLHLWEGDDAASRVLGM